MTLTAWFALYSLLIILASLAGGWVPILIRLTHRRLQVATSLIAGFMLGVALLHLLPHALMAIPAATAAGWMLTGLLTMFFLERCFSYHHHTAPGDTGLPPVTADPEPHATCDHPGDPIDHAHGHTTAHAACDHAHPPPSHTHPLSWTGVGIGLVIHSLIAGAALAAAMTPAPGSSPVITPSITPGMFPGLAVALIIILHKPFDSMTLLTLLKSSGRSTAAQHLINLLFALIVPLGGVLFFLGIRSLGAEDSTLIGGAVAFAAGVFLCVALADLLPEVHFHQHDRTLLSAAVLLGLALAWAIAHFETHPHPPEASLRKSPPHATDPHTAGHPAAAPPRPPHDHAGHAH